MGADWFILVKNVKAQDVSLFLKYFIESIYFSMRLKVHIYISYLDNNKLQYYFLLRLCVSMLIIPIKSLELIILLIVLYTLQVEYMSEKIIYIFYKCILNITALYKSTMTK